MMEAFQSALRWERVLEARPTPTATPDDVSSFEDAFRGDDVETSDDWTLDDVYSDLADWATAREEEHATNVPANNTPEPTAKKYDVWRVTLQGRNDYWLARESLECD